MATKGYYAQYVHDGEWWDGACKPLASLLEAKAQTSTFACAKVRVVHRNAAGCDTVIWER